MNNLVVIADDITGAAEIAGVCLRYGVSVTFDFNIQRSPSTDVWIIASDTRSLPEQEACDIVRKIARQLKALQIKTVFKKIDSALRGHILPEIEALREYIPAERVFILPANPETGRTIQNGIYYINGLPLDQTAFAHDPDFPARTASVREILQPATSDALIPDISSKEDYEKYARQIRTGILPAGGSVFFEACFPEYFPLATLNTPRLSSIYNAVRKESSALMICGSTHEVSQRFFRENQIFEPMEISTDLVEELLNKPDNFQKCIEKVISIFNRKKKLAIKMKNESEVPAGKVKEILSKITAGLINRCEIDELLIEGGATACACLQSAGFTSLIPVQEYARGIVRFQISGKEKPYLTIKPGSYEWSPKLFES